jgi:nitroreductase
MDIVEVIRGRRSVREFLPDEIPEEDLSLILDMARFAPSANNLQPWRFLLLRNVASKARLKQIVERAVIEKIEGLGLKKKEARESKQQYRQFIAKLFVAPVLVFVFVDQRRYPKLVCYEGAMAVQNMMLTAHALGYGTSFQTTIFPEELIKEYFAVPDDYRFICTVPIGKPVSPPEIPEKKPLETFIWEERIHL